MISLGVWGGNVLVEAKRWRDLFGESDDEEEFLGF